MAHISTRNTSGIGCAHHTVPYGTVHSRDTFPGTSCLATIVLSLRDADLPELLALSNVQTQAQALRAWLRSVWSPMGRDLPEVLSLSKVQTAGSFGGERR
jgi:hypothetical protein